jgi:hypothetical protein
MEYWPEVRGGARNIQASTKVVYEDTGILNTTVAGGNHAQKLCGKRRSDSCLIRTENVNSASTSRRIRQFAVRYQHSRRAYALRVSFSLNWHDMRHRRRLEAFFLLQSTLVLWRVESITRRPPFLAGDSRYMPWVITGVSKPYIRNSFGKRKRDMGDGLANLPQTHTICQDSQSR